MRSHAICTYQVLLKPAADSNTNELSCYVFLYSTVPSPTVTITLGPADNVTLHHGNSLTLSCRIQLDPAIDSPVLVVGALSGPGGATSDIVVVSTGIYQVSLAIASLQESPLDIYTCNSTVSSMPSLMFVTDSAEVSASIAISILSTVPGLVQNVEATSISSSTVKLSWEEPEMTGGRILLYYITVSNGTAIVESKNVTETNYTITDLGLFGYDNTLFIEVNHQCYLFVQRVLCHTWFQ